MRAISHGIILVVALFMSGPARAQTETIEELYKKALKEEGVLNCYCSLAQINAEKIYPVFEKRFPGIKINHVDATSDKLSARAIAEARGGKTIADVVEFGLEDINKIYEQGLLLERVPPEAAAYPANLKGPYWTANNLIFFVGAWNTNLVKKEEEPKALDDFGDPRWKGRLIAEPRDYEILIALNHKHKSLEKARAVLARIAANNVEFHRGHSQLAELLVAGQAAACFTCYSHHFPARKRKGAPVDYMLTEGAAGIIAVAVMKNAPHPNTAWLFNRWAASEEGQTVYSKGGRTPAHPKVEPTEKIRPAVIYAVGVEDLKQYTKFEKIWKEVFKLR
ncbi:MAG TPA: ABC transporter substrate-binding protein [Methylomirabilota bacterium]|nr:ABC transporter substrate-binding protein [Methylomirabilota bacterium]